MLWAFLRFLVLPAGAVFLSACARERLSIHTIKLCGASMNKKALLQEIDWQDVSEVIEEVNPALADVISRISPDHHYKLIKATYAYGDLIVKEGRLCLPIENDRLYKELNYSPIPLSLLLNKSSEAFIENENNPSPLNILKPGSFFGTFETINFMMNKESDPTWHVSAGLRSTFMLPKISNAAGIKRLRTHYHIAHSLHFEGLSDHWELFKQINLKPYFTEPWKSEVLFFPKSWFMKRKDPAWYPFYQLIWEQTWIQAQYAMSDFNFRNEWQTCLKMIERRRLKPSPYIIDTIKHLLNIILGFAPFFTPAGDLELGLPLIELQRAFTEVYRLERYIPTIMIPAIFNSQQSSTGYYSLAFPTVMSGTHTESLMASFMLDLKLIKLIMDYLSEKSGLSSPLQQVLLGYFHNFKDKFQDIALSTEIATQDPAFIREHEKFKERSFCAISPFWRGCIRIGSKLRDNDKA